MKYSTTCRFATIIIDQDGEIWIPNNTSQDWKFLKHIILCSEEKFQQQLKLLHIVTSHGLKSFYAVGNAWWKSCLSLRTCYNFVMSTLFAASVWGIHTTAREVAVSVCLCNDLKVGGAIFALPWKWKVCSAFWIGSILNLKDLVKSVLLVFWIGSWIWLKYAVSILDVKYLEFEVFWIGSWIWWK